MNYPNVGTAGHIDHGQRARADAFAESIQKIANEPVLFKPTHWPPRLTRMTLAVRLGITRLLLERGA